VARDRRDVSRHFAGALIAAIRLAVPVPPGEVELLFLGTGTSAGVPMIGCHCAVCSSTDSRDKRTRPSVVISYGDTRVLIDTTPELRLQAVGNKVDRIDAIVFTHAHADHIFGLDDVRRFNAVRGCPIDVFVEDRAYEAIDRCFAYAFKAPDPAQVLFRPHLVRRDITDRKPFTIAGVTWTPIPLIHGDLSVLGFRVGNLAYCTDVSFIPEESFDLLKNLDVLVLDALQHKRHTTHFSLEQATEAATRIGAKQTLFTHIAHGMGHAETNRLLPPHMQLAFDGQVARASL
jgi:phosphoribosyl 1,2-cyclic phosphate phosphodiesterase